MNAVVLEVRGDRAAVLREDGIVQEIERKCTVGETIVIDEVAERKALIMRSRNKRRTYLRKFAAAAAAIIIIAGISLGYTYENVMAYSYVTVDQGDYSIEYTLNRKDQVIDVRACNEVSKELAEALSGETKKAGITDAISLALDSMPEISDGEDEIILAAVSVSNEHTEKLAEMIDPGKNLYGTGEMPVNVETSTYDVRKEAIDAGMSIGRYQRSAELAPEEIPGDINGSGDPSAVQPEADGLVQPSISQSSGQPQNADTQQGLDQTQPFEQIQQFNQTQSPEQIQSFDQAQPSGMEPPFEQGQPLNQTQPSGQMQQFGEQQDLKR